MLAGLSHFEDRQRFQSMKRVNFTLHFVAFWGLLAFEYCESLTFLSAAYGCMS